MANQALESFAAYMEAKDLKVRLMEEDENVCYVGFQLDNTEVGILLFFGEDLKDVHFVGRDFVKIPDDKTDVVLSVCNECNKNFRWVKFVYNEEDNRVTCQCDAVVQEDSVAEECYEIVMRLAGIVDEAYPSFMKAIWA